MVYLGDITVSQLRAMSQEAIVQELNKPGQVITHDGGWRFTVQREVVSSPVVVAQPTPLPTVTVRPVASPTLTSPVSSSVTLYKDPNLQANAYLAANPSLIKITSQAQGIWLGGWSGNVYDTVRKHVTQANGKTPVFVAYNIPGRDNGNYSAGGLGSPGAYYSWIGSLAAGIGNAPAIVVLEPDALGLSRDIPADKKAERYAMLSGAIDILKRQPNTKVYVDASMWVPEAEMATIMRAAGVPKANGFAINTSGYEAQDKVQTYGDNLSRAMGGMRWVADTSRNGNGALTGYESWCNPEGRKLGLNPQFNPRTGVDAWLWIKNPGESDGTCKGGPSAGSFYLQRALELVR